MEPKICTMCKEEFIPSSNHLKCPNCRHACDKRVCRYCGNPTRYGQCRECYNLLFKNGNWKGGKTKHKAGYIMVRNPEHPRSQSNSGYVFEHILVMEESLGRCLLPGETVHHKNGVRDDNRPENLELWVSSHPAGSRVSDLIDWAHQLLEKYSPET